MALHEGPERVEPVVSAQELTAASSAQVVAAFSNRYRDAADGIVWSRDGTKFEYVDGAGDA